MCRLASKPAAPLVALEDENLLDPRLREKLSLLESSAGKQSAEAVVSDLWSIMKQNGG